VEQLELQRQYDDEKEKRLAEIRRGLSMPKKLVVFPNQKKDQNLEVELDDDDDLIDDYASDSEPSSFQDELKLEKPTVIPRPKIIYASRTVSKFDVAFSAFSIRERNQKNRLFRFEMCNPRLTEEFVHTFTS
jgi:hypothetical protein